MIFSLAFRDKLPVGDEFSDISSDLIYLDLKMWNIHKGLKNKLKIMPFKAVIVKIPTFRTKIFLKYKSKPLKKIHVRKRRIKISMSSHEKFWR